MNRRLITIGRVLMILAVLAIAGFLRLRAVEMLPVDYDEDDYLRAGQQYANGIRAGDWRVFTRENYRTEHPPVTKMIYGVALLAVPPFPEVPDRPTTAEPDQSLAIQPLKAARSASALLGTLESAALAVINPLAGFFLAVHTFDIKYTSQAMLEGAPAFTSLLVALFYLRWRKTRHNRWLIAAAIALGATAAGKYYYALVGVAVSIHWLATSSDERRTVSDWVKWLRPIALWGLLALAVFFLFDPYLWPDPLHRLAQSITYHAGYAQSDAVKSAGYPWWQILNWLAISVPWHPGVFLVEIDILVLLFAIFGLKRSREQHPVFLLWLGLGIGFLLLWPTRWPQYSLLVTAPLSIVAADGFQAVIAEPIGRRLQRKGEKQAAAVERGHATMNRWRQVLPWLLPGLLALALITLFPLIFQIAVSMTDFSARAIKDGVTGGVWRELWLGITGQVKAVPVDLFGQSSSTKVHYAGLQPLLMILFNAGDFYVFELIWTILAVASQAALGVGVALLLHRQGVRFRGFWQALFILPWAVPEFVAALTWSQIFEPRFGYMMMASKTWSQSAPGVAQALSSWQERPDAALVVLLISALWFGFPFMLLSARAGLKLIPKDVYDAAAIDGAAGWQLFRHVTWPLIFPLLIPAIILRSIFSFNQFYLFAVMRTPVITLAAISYFIFDGGKYATSAAINIVTVIILIGLVVWFNRLSKAGEGVTYA